MMNDDNLLKTKVKQNFDDFTFQIYSNEYNLS